MPILHIALYIFYLALFLWLISRLSFFANTGLKRDNLWTFFLLKVVGGVALTLVYTYYYTDQSKADIYRYFADSKIISLLLWQHPKTWFAAMTGIGLSEPDNFQYLLNTLYFSHPSADTVTNNQLIIRIISLLNYFSFSDIYINTLFFSFLSFIGLVALYQSFKKYFEDFPQLLCLPLFLLPSVIFWGSGLLKEALVFFLLGFWAYGLMQWKGWRGVLIAVICALALWFVRPPFVMALMPAIGAFYLVHIITKEAKDKTVLNRWLELGLLVVLALGLVVLSGANICESLINKRNEFVQLGLQENPGSYFDTRLISSSGGLLQLTPSAFVHAAFGPFLTGISNKAELLFALETALLWLFLMLALVTCFAKPPANKLLMIVPLLVGSLTFYLIIGLTVPIMGAIVHYRVLATPFLMIALFGVVNLHKFKYVVNRSLKANF